MELDRISTVKYVIFDMAFYVSILLLLMWYPDFTLGWKIAVSIFLYITYSIFMLITIIALMDIKTICLSIARVPETKLFDIGRWDKWLELSKNKTFLYYISILFRLLVIAYATLTSMALIPFSSIGVILLALNSTLKDKIKKFITDKDNRTKYGIGASFYNLSKGIEEISKK